MIGCPNFVLFLFLGSCEKQDVIKEMMMLKINNKIQQSERKESNQIEGVPM